MARPRVYLTDKEIRLEAIKQTKTKYNCTCLIKSGYALIVVFTITP